MPVAVTVTEAVTETVAVTVCDNKMTSSVVAVDSTAVYLSAAPAGVSA